MIPLLVAAALTIPQAVTAAQEHHGPLQCGTPTVDAAPYPDATDPDAPLVSGWVSAIGAPDCAIHITPNWWGDDYEDCGIIAHEYLHLQGHAHREDGDPNGPSRIELDPPVWCLVPRTIYVTFKEWDAADYDGWGA